jgi:predicted DNA-binding transcriptional regulator AlpA
LVWAEHFFCFLLVSAPRSGGAGDLLMSHDDELMTTEELAAMTKTPPSRWNKARLTGDSPPFVKLGHLVRYRRSDVLAWLAAQPRVNSTSELAA